MICETRSPPGGPGAPGKIPQNRSMFDPPRSVFHPGRHYNPRARARSVREKRGKNKGKAFRVYFTSIHISSRFFDMLLKVTHIKNIKSGIIHIDGFYNA
jgi:hypothetical protein